jgi:hypothetical protein
MSLEVIIRLGLESAPPVNAQCSGYTSLDRCITIDSILLTLRIGQFLVSVSRRGTRRGGYPQTFVLTTLEEFGVKIVVY